MLVPYNFELSGPVFKEYYLNQNGNGLAVFRGATVQRGHGIGGFFANLVKGALPLVKSGAKTIGKELLNTGVNVAKDFLGGERLNTSVKRRLTSGGRRLIDNLSQSLTSPKSVPRKRKAKRPNKSSKTLKTNTKRRRVSIFDKPFQG